jgi:C-terminal processing protease CtpA/Prc
LIDLQTGYVDPVRIRETQNRSFNAWYISTFCDDGNFAIDHLQVNPTKLFETGVSAMLRSLDPYTEFENLDTAKYMQESVSGKYAGVGMVISGSKDIGPTTLPQKKDAPSTSTFSSPAGTGTGSDDSEAEPSSTSPSSSTDTPTDTDTEGSDGRAPQVPGKSKVGSKLGKKDAAAANGVSVVDAFEGYAYDAGMRVGDRILSIDGVDTTKMTVEQVRHS